MIRSGAHYRLAFLQICAQLGFEALLPLAVAIRFL